MRLKTKKIPNNVLSGTKKVEPGLWKRGLIYFSLGLLWASTLFGLLIIPAIVKIGSRHSYLAERVNGNAWIYVYIIVALYTILVSLYLVIEGYAARYVTIILLNISLLVAFIAVSFVSFYFILL